jgi:hypothetical protein
MRLDKPKFGHTILSCNRLLEDGIANEFCRGGFLTPYRMRDCVQP